MFEFTESEITQLLDLGYKAGFMMDIRPGDQVAISPTFRTVTSTPPEDVLMLTVDRVINIVETDLQLRVPGMQTVTHSVICFVGLDQGYIPRHYSYGNTYPCFVLKQEVEDVSGSTEGN